MRSKMLLCLCLALMLGLPCVAASQELVVAFEFEGAGSPPPTGFLMTMLRVTAPRETSQFRLPNSGRASCNAVSDATLTENSQCGRTPDCLPPGIYSLWAQAEWGEKVSPMSNVATCEALPACRYNCTTLEVPAELQALITNPDGTPREIDQAAIDQFATPGAPASTGESVGSPVQASGPVLGGPAVASVQARPATVDDIPDTITPALKAMTPLPG
jgi:hypothetical protein